MAPYIGNSRRSSLRRPPNSWMVVAEKGCGNIKVYEFTRRRAALDFFGRQWVARVMVDQSGKELHACSGWNIYALRTLRLWLNSLQSATEFRETSPSTIAVSRLSGETFEADFPGSATISEVKNCAANFWSVPAAVQNMILETAVIEDDETVASLVANHGAGRLNLMMIATTDLTEIKRKIQHERSLPTNVRSMRNLTQLLKEEEALERALRQSH